MSNPKTLIFLALITLSLIAVSSSSSDHLHRREKLSHFRLFLHDTESGPNPSRVKIVNSPANHTFPNKMFGSVHMFDDPITAGPDPKSDIIGRAQGTLAVASQKDTALLMAMNFHFRQGKYNGSSIAILGRNSFSDNVREMAVIGGTGLFRLARGYALTSTHSIHVATNVFTFEYNLYVLHY